MHSHFLTGTNSFILQVTKDKVNIETLKKTGELFFPPGIALHFLKYKRMQTLMDGGFFFCFRGKYYTTSIGREGFSMENKQDLNDIMQQLTEIKNNNQKNMDNMESINLIMVDDNNGTVKDAKLGNHMIRLNQKIQELSDTIIRTEQLLRDDYS